MSSRNLAKSMPLVWGMLTLLFVLPALAAAQVRLLPAPREANFVGETALQAAIAVSVPGRDVEDEFAGRDLEEAVEAAGLADRKDVGAAYRVELLRSGSAQAKAVLAKLGWPSTLAMQDKGYVLSVEPHETFVIAASGTGIFYGVQTPKQLLPLPGGTSRLCPEQEAFGKPAQGVESHRTPPDLGFREQVFVRGVEGQSNATCVSAFGSSLA